jgi:Sec-independent protein secretion pathway component TatC
MSRLTHHLAAAAVLGVLVGQLGWIDPLFVPLVLAGPPLSGALAAGAGLAYRWIAVLWLSAGLAMLAGDWLVNPEDVLFHLVLAVVMALLAGVGYAVVRLTSRRRAAGAR